MAASEPSYPYTVKPTLDWAKDTGADLAKTNMNGGASVIGHPLGAERRSHTENGWWSSAFRLKG